MKNSEEIIHGTKIRSARQIQKYLARENIWNCQQKPKKNYGRHPLRYEDSVRDPQTLVSLEN
jgi:hypothetical protein